MKHFFVNSILSSNHNRLHRIPIPHNPPTNTSKPTTKSYILLHQTLHRHTPLNRLHQLPIHQLLRSRTLRLNPRRIRNPPLNHRLAIRIRHLLQTLLHHSAVAEQQPHHFPLVQAQVTANRFLILLERLMVTRRSKHDQREGFDSQSKTPFGVERVEKAAHVPPAR